MILQRSPKLDGRFVQPTCKEYWIIMKNFIIKVLWKHCLDNKKLKSEVKGRIMGVKIRMNSFDLYFSLNLAIWTFWNFYETVLKTAKLHQFMKEPALKKKRKAPY